VIYTTHSPAFLDVARLDEAAFVRRNAGGTHVTQPRATTPAEDFRVLTEFDVSRSELLLARATLLVEGQTERLTFPYVFEALGLDADREGISVVSCGGKSNIALFARAAQAAGVPAVAVFDRDAPPGRRPNRAMRALNAEITAVVGAERTVMLEPDFERMAELRGHAHKPERAWRAFRSLTRREMPEPLVRAAALAAELAAA
jgi:predicted ATP-dependent endonuclease of OLD family